MPPAKPLPISDEFSSPEHYVSSLLEFASTNDLFQILCGGVHILDFFTNEPGLFEYVLEPEWQEFLMRCDPMDLLDFLLRDDPDAPAAERAWPDPPESLRQYVKAIRRLSLRRALAPAAAAAAARLPVLPRQVAVGMNAKKRHEVVRFADYVDRLAAEVVGGVTHLVDLGSGQNYLGRALASPPYGRDVVAVEGHAHNQAGARELDVLAGLAETGKVLRNKKVWQSLVDGRRKDALDDKARRRMAEQQHTPEQVAAAELRPRRELEAVYRPGEGRGMIQYVTGRLETGDLSDVVGQIRAAPAGERRGREPSLMAISIHSCGNLSHFGIRSMVLNPSIKAVAIVGCCYNLLTERLGPPTYKLPYMRPSLQAVNGRVVRESERYDPQGFPMSDRVSSYNGSGIRFNITARMMACQAPQNWTEVESDSFFTRHFYRAVLQKIFLDKGVITKVYHDKTPDGSDGPAPAGESPFNMSTNPVIIGSLGKSCFRSFGAYVRGAVRKLAASPGSDRYSAAVDARVGGMTDDEIEAYAAAYAPRKRELSAMWTLMAFSAGVVESLIVTDRWLFLREHAGLVRDCWVEPVFDYRESPRNLVVVGIKRGGEEAATGG